MVDDDGFVDELKRYDDLVWRNGIRTVCAEEMRRSAQQKRSLISESEETWFAHTSLMAPQVSRAAQQQGKKDCERAGAAGVSRMSFVHQFDRRSSQDHLSGQGSSSQVARTSAVVARRVAHADGGERPRQNFGKSWRQQHRSAQEIGWMKDAESASRCQRRHYFRWRRRVLFQRRRLDNDGGEPLEPPSAVLEAFLERSFFGNQRKTDGFEKPREFVLQEVVLPVCRKSIQHCQSERLGASCVERSAQWPLVVLLRRISQRRHQLVDVHLVADRMLLPQRHAFRRGQRLRGKGRENLHYQRKVHSQCKL